MITKTLYRRERGYCSICWSSTSFQMSLQTADNGDTGNKGMSEYDLDCGRWFYYYFHWLIGLLAKFHDFI